MQQAKLRQRLLFMAYNLVAFTLIFALFAFIIYSQISSSLFSPVHDDLELARLSISAHSEYVDDQINFRFVFSDDGVRKYLNKDMQPEEDREPIPLPPKAGRDAEFPQPDMDAPPESAPTLHKVHIPMRVQVVVRDSGSNIVNAHVLGRFYWENILDQIPFDGSQLESVTVFRMEDGSVFHSLAFEAQASDGGDFYIQLIANMDGEYAIINSFVRILVVCVTVFVALSIAASYFLSKMSMTPLLKSWARQTEFVGNASHELRTPLTIIQNKLESLLAAPSDTILDRADDIAVSLSETRRLSKLTSDLMTLARADSNATQLEKEEFSLDELVLMVCEPYGELAEMEGKAMDLQLSYAGTLTADKARIHELMVILLDNALKYTKEGERISIRTSAREGRAVIEVVDTGIGIQEESATQIFDRFYREAKARSRESGGSGLGLSIAKWIVEAHGGSIKALPNQPAGTVMQVRLSCKQP